MLLAADAAHGDSPVGGRGMNLGIDDAIAAAQAIVKGATASYSEERRPVGAKAPRMTEATRKTTSSACPTEKLAVSGLMTAMQHIGALPGPLLRRMGALT